MASIHSNVSGEPMMYVFPVYLTLFKSFLLGIKLQLISRIMLVYYCECCHLIIATLLAIYSSIDIE